MHGGGGGWWSYLRYDENQKAPDIDRALLRRVFAYGQPYQLLLIGVLGTILIISGLSVVPAILIRELFDVAIENKDLGYLTRLGSGMVAVPLLNAIIGVAQRWMSSKAGEGIIFDLRRALYGHLQGMSLRFFTGTKTGELVSRLDNDVVGAQTAITGTFVTILSNVVSLAFVLTVMLSADWLLTILAIAALPLFVYPARKVARVLRGITQEQMQHNATMGAILNETFNISGALLVKLFGRSQTELDKFSHEAGQVRDLGVRRALIGRWFFAALGLVSAVGSAGVFWVGGYRVINGDLTNGTLIMFVALLPQLYGPLSAMSNARVEFATSLVSFERVFEVLDLEHDIQQRTDPVGLEPVRGTVEFRDVFFRYESDGPAGLAVAHRFTPDVEGDVVEQKSSREWALADISFTINPGELAALVGPSGAGKTTMSYLLPRLYDVNEGAVLLDGVDVRDVSLDTLATSIGIVTQEAYLFHDTIAANLRYARRDATDEELAQAAATANIATFIESLEDSYETVVGERGYRLSGGEKQRLALARVILKDPKILVLDEATAHLDSQSEALIQEALERVMEHRTSLVIAHRLSTVLAADRILVVDGGRLVEQGTHEELVESGGLYSSLYATQFRHDSTDA
jgi:ATP-binding cassette subfamily B protein